MAAGLLVVNLAPAAALLVCWVLYLSLTVAGQSFLAFQWDALLLETGFLAIFLAPLHLTPRRPASEAPPAAVSIPVPASRSRSSPSRLSS